MGKTGIDRRRFLERCSALGVAGTLFPGALYAVHRTSGLDDITISMIEQAEKIAGLSFTEADREMLVEDLNEQRGGFEAIRALKLDNSVPPAFYFDPVISGRRDPAIPPVLSVDHTLPEIELPSSGEEIAFLSIRELSSLVRSRKISCTDLTRLYLSRLKAHDPVLECVITYTEERALNQAAALDAELDKGMWRGPLHGIPWGAKDLLAVDGYPTTWGATPYKNQVLEGTATVVHALDEAGAILVAKLSLGALAWGDVWFGGQTKNPRNPTQGSSGSSAGPASAVAAGLVGFAIGSETLGSIVSPSNRCGVFGLRPTFGRVSKHGAMALSWTMDKLGPMARSVDDCALVFAAIQGFDPKDVSTRNADFVWPVDETRLKTLRIGYLKSAFEREYSSRESDARLLRVLKDAGYELVPVSLPDTFPLGAMIVALNVEAAAAFDELTLSRGTDKMVRQSKNAWPHAFRAARFVPAVEYIQANRMRTLLMKEMETLFEQVDVLVSPSFGSSLLQITNLTGHPCCVIPHSWENLSQAELQQGAGSFSITGPIEGDNLCLAIASIIS